MSDEHVWKPHVPSSIACTSMKSETGKRSLLNNRLQRRVLSVGICFGTAILVISIRGGFDAVPPRPEPPQQVSYSPEEQRTRFNPGAEIDPDESGESTPSKAFMYMMMGKTGSFSLPGVVLPPVESANSATIADDSQIIGVEVDGRWRAYCIGEMQSPTTHVVNDLFAEVPVTVTFCDLSNCARVFTQPDELNRPLDVGVGGFRDGQLLLHVDRRNFSQDAPDVPLHDLEFERTTWKEWKTAHPDTEVCSHLDPTDVFKMPNGTPVIGD